MLGTREPDKYGNQTLEQINSDLKKAAQSNSAEIDFSEVITKVRLLIRFKVLRQNLLSSIQLLTHIRV